jgi:Fic family protein
MFDHPGQAEPYLPRFSEELLGLANLVATEGAYLMDKVPHRLHSGWSNVNMHANAHYSNLIESESSGLYLSAHKKGELTLDSIGSIGTDALTSTTLSRVHREFFDEIGEGYIEPGALRSFNVQVHRHTPPRWERVPSFLARADEVYMQCWKTSAEILIVAAAAHHRMQWIHPFPDGNGRAARLQSQLALRRLGSNFWSLSQGLWNCRAEYYQWLEAADSPRLGDLDGRGNLSQKRLEQWCQFFLSVCRQEIDRNIRYLKTDT